MKNRKVTTDILFGFFTQVAIRFRGILFIPLISINLGVAAFGAYTQLLAVVTLAITVVELGLHQALIRYGRRTDDIADLYYSLLVVVLLSASIAAVVMGALAPTLSELTLSTGEYTETFRIGSLLVLTMSVFRFSKNYFRVDSRIKLYSTIDAVRVYAIVAAVLTSILLLDAGLSEVFRAIVLVEVIVILGLHAQIVREIGVTLPSFRDLRTHLEYSVPVSLSLLTGNASSRADRVMIGFFIGASAVGVYSIAYQISVGIIVYVTAIRQTFFPELSKFIDENKKQKCANYVHTGLRYFLMIAIPTVGGMYLIGPDVISILTEGQGVPSPALIAVIALGIATRGVDEIFGVVMRAIEETYRRARILATGAIANIGINAVAIPALGIMGAALATVATYVLVSALTMARVNETVPTRLPWYTATRCLGATLLMIGVVELLGISSPPVIVVLCVPIYFGLLFVLRELTVGEVRSRLDLG